MAHLAQQLHESMARYNWIGFYLVDPADPGTLVVGRYAAVSRRTSAFLSDTGLCGAAATSGKTVVVNDVSKDPRYLSGSELVKSNMVVPIFSQNMLAAEIDVESYLWGRSQLRNRNLWKLVLQWSART